MPIFAQLSISSTCPFPFLCIPFSKRKKPEAKRQKRVLYIGSGRVRSRSPWYQQIPRAAPPNAPPRPHVTGSSSFSFARSFFVDPSSSRALVAFRVFVAGPVCSPCFPLCALSSFFLSLCLCLERVYASVFSAVFVVVNLVCSSHRSIVSGIDSVLPFSMPVASFVALMRVDHQLLLFLFLSHVLLTVVQQFHVQT